MPPSTRTRVFPPVPTGNVTTALKDISRSYLVGNAALGMEKWKDEPSDGMGGGGDREKEKGSYS